MATSLAPVQDLDSEVTASTSKAYSHKKAPCGAFVFYAWSTNFLSASASATISVVDGKSGMVGNGKLSRLASVSLE